MAELRVQGVNLKSVQPSRCPMVIAPGQGSKCTSHFRTANSTRQMGIKQTYNTYRPMVNQALLIVALDISDLK